MVLLTLIGAALAIEPPEEFAAALMAEIRAAHPQCELTPAGPMAARLVCAEREMGMQFERIYRACAQQPDLCPAERERYLSVLAQALAPPPPVALSAIMPVVRSKAYVEAIPLDARSQVVVDPLFADMALIWMVDRGDAVRSLAPADLEALGLEQGQLREATRVNLAREVANASQSSRKQIYSLEAGFYTSSLILIPELWERISGGQPLWAIVVSNDQILYTTSPKSLSALRKSAARIARGHPHPVSLVVLEWRGGQWAPVGE